MNISLERTQKISEPENSFRRPLYVLAILLPLFLLIVHYFAYGNLFKALPYWSDELGYWRSLYSFSECGFRFGSSGGFANYDAAVGPFGCHGLAPFLAWGWYALIFGWSETSIVTANFILLALALILFIVIVRPKAENTLYFILALLFCPALELYFSSSMLEIPILAAGIVYAALLIVSVRDGKTSAFIWALLVGLYLSLLRVTSVVLLFPLIWQRCGFRLDKKALLSLALYALLTLGLYKTVNIFISEYPYWFTVTLKGKSLAEKAALLLWHLRLNLKIYFLSIKNPSVDRYMELFYLLVLFYLLLCAIRDKNRRGMYLSLFLMLGGILGAVLLLYDVGGFRDFRTLSVVLLCVVLWLVNDETMPTLHKRVLLGLNALCLLLILYHAYPVFTIPERFETMEKSDALSVLADEPESIAMTARDGAMRLMVNIPPQTGVKWVLTGEQLSDANTRYILSDGEESIGEDYRLLLETEEFGKIYERRSNEN